MHLSYIHYSPDDSSPTVFALCGMLLYVSTYKCYACSLSDNNKDKLWYSSFMYNVQ